MSVLLDQLTSGIYTASLSDGATLMMESKLQHLIHPVDELLKHLNVDRLTSRLAELGTIGRTPGNGLTRLAGSPSAALAERRVAEWMCEAGLRVCRDSVGNLFGSLAPHIPPTVMIGSHLDTVVDAGQFDGCLGVLAGIEVAAAIGATLGTETAVAVAAFANEEGVRYQPDLMGSSVYAGLLRSEDALAAVDSDGTSYAAALAEAESDEVVALPFGQPSRPSYYVELHIEQGPTLHELGRPVAAVAGIQGFRWFEIDVRGVANHAGTTPMKHRRDAVAASTDILSGLLADGRAPDTGDFVVTCGTFRVESGAINTVPGRAVFTLDMRDPDFGNLDLAVQRLRQACLQAERTHGVTVEVRELASQPTVLFDRELVALATASVAAETGTPLTVMSGAAHDAQVLQRLCPTVMLFAPSIGGVSHSPTELTDEADIATSTRSLLRLVHMLLTKDILSKGLLL